MPVEFSTLQPGAPATPDRTHLLARLEHVEADENLRARITEAISNGADSMLTLVDNLLGDLIATDKRPDHLISQLPEVQVA